ncbi:hypothetical protein N0V93_003256 [Gnomoniopsis smithogilvyi]|uniref:F-box domain-containing protein n=1 Tax=Gnomoniopsis smithogilvyi TaxID=1191159 RepID=A0A9W8YWB6_9PEZI|nr:hypothetical protein N0V93_003256 [Gnomoniopsis smithogilvyi]
MRSLRELFNHVRASTSGSDGQVWASTVIGSDLLARLPIELHILLLAYLGADDVVAALNSSKTLRMVWLSDDVWPWLADRWYPGLSQAIWVEAARRGAMFRRLSTPRSRTDYRYKLGYTISNKKKKPIILSVGPSELFRQMLGRLCRKNGGRFGSALHHRLQLLEESVFSLSTKVPLDQGGVTSINDLDEHLLEKAESSCSRFMMYNNGRVAWWPNSYSSPYIAVVDDFRKAKRKIYRFPDHDGAQRGYKTAMSNELLVIARQTSVHAWHFDMDLLCSFVVPENLERCVAEGSNVLILTRSAELYAWQFGGALRRICLNDVACYQPGPVRMGGLVEAPLQSHSPVFHIPRRQGLVFTDSGMLLDFILHPSLLDVLFVVTMHEGEVRVHEIHGSKLVESHLFHPGTIPALGQWKKINEYLRWEKCDSYGGYCLFSVYLGVDNELAPSDLQSPDRPFCTCGQKTGLVSVCFNIYTRVFRVECHHFLHSRDHHVAPVPAAFHIWQNKLYTSYAPEDMRAGMPITALRCCMAVQDQQDDASDTPVFTASASSQGLLHRRHRSSVSELLDLPESRIQPDHWRKQVGFGLDVTARCAPSSARSSKRTLWQWDAPNVHQTQTITGDDEFLICVVDGVYTVWSFGDEIPSPKELVNWTLWNRA